MIANQRDPRHLKAIEVLVLSRDNAQDFESDLKIAVRQLMPVEDETRASVLTESAKLKHNIFEIDSPVRYQFSSSNQSSPMPKSDNSIE